MYNLYFIMYKNIKCTYEVELLAIYAELELGT